MKTIFFPFKLDQANPAAGGGGNTNPANPPPATPDPRQAEIDRLVAENANLRKSTKENEGALATIKAELDGLKKSGLKSQGDWQKLAGDYENEAKTWKEKFEKTNNAFVRTLRMGEVKQEALKKGLLPEAVADIAAMSFDEVEVIIDANNQFVVKGADLAAEGLTKLRPHWFKSATPPPFNPGGGGNPPPPAGKLTLEQAKAKYVAALANRAKDPAAFNKAWEEYSQAVTDSKKSAR